MKRGRRPRPEGHRGPDPRGQAFTDQRRLRRWLKSDVTLLRAHRAVRGTDFPAAQADHLAWLETVSRTLGSSTLSVAAVEIVVAEWQRRSAHFAGRLPQPPPVVVVVAAPTRVPGASRRRLVPRIATALWRRVRLGGVVLRGASRGCRPRQLVPGRALSRRISAAARACRP
jgi:hypothetical protein